jgi:hypothetical protein
MNAALIALSPRCGQHDPQPTTQQLFDDECLVIPVSGEPVAIACQRIPLAGHRPLPAGIGRLWMPAEVSCVLRSMIARRYAEKRGSL